MKLEVFYDYTCPFCLKGHEMLLELLPDYAGLEVEWRPCEAHPRPERYGRHSDLCARGMYIAGEKGADPMEYHRVMYNAAQKERQDIENPEVIAAIAESLVDKEDMLAALAEGAYTDRLDDNNQTAWGEHGFVAVPSLYMNGKKLGAIENVGLTAHGIREFLDAMA